MNIRIGLVLFLFSGYLVTAQTTITQSIFLIGDSGEPYIADEAYGQVLRQKVEQAGQGAVVLYLGDNVYPAGLSDSGSRNRTSGERTLQAQVSWIKGLNAKGIFIPGNHDWAHWGRRGLQYVTNQRQWIDSLKSEQFRFLPEDGCPGPKEISLNGNTVLVILDTQWFLHQFNKPEEDSDCDCKTTADVVASLADIFNRNSNKRIIVAAHHPLITYGEHGGVFTLSNHLFPLRDINPNLYIPLPVIGSFYPLYRKLFGHSFPEVKTGTPITFSMFGAAIAEFEFTLTFANAPVDRFARGDKTALTDEEKKGALLFFGEARCAACHAVSGHANEMFSDFKTHVIGVPQIVPHVTNTPFDGPNANEDFGREEVSGDPQDRYKFRTSPLRNAAVQPTFMHNGAFRSLEDAVLHHLNVFDSALNYTTAAQQLDPDLTTSLDAIHPVLARLDPILATPVILTDDQFRQLVAFVRHGLLDPRAKRENLRRLVPKSVPSGRPVLFFEFPPRRREDNQ